MCTNQVQTIEDGLPMRSERLAPHPNPPLTPKAVSSEQAIKQAPTQATKQAPRRITEALLFGSATIQARAGIDRKGSFKNTPAISKELLRLIAISNAEAEAFSFEIKEGCRILLDAVNEELEAVDKKLKHFDVMKGALQKRRLTLVASQKRAEECADTSSFFHKQFKDGHPADFSRLSIL